MEVSGICAMLTAKQDEQRPIIFICHSLGGIVAKQVNQPGL